MAIKALPTTQKAAYASIPGLTPPKAAVPKVTVPSTIGYGGVGWNYPTAMPGVPAGATAHYSTLPGVAPTFSVPGSNIQSGLPTGAPIPGSPSDPSTPNPAAAVIPKNWQDYYNEAAGTQQWQDASQSYTSLLNNLKTQGQSQVNSIFANLGYDLTPQMSDPYLSKYFGPGGDFTIDPTAMATAAANPNSSRAQIEQAYNQGVNSSRYSANAMGTLGSGASTAAINTLAQNRQLQQNQVQNDALTSIRNLITGYAGAQDSAAQTLRSQQMGIASALAQQPGPVYPVDQYTENTPTQPLGGGNNTAQSARPPTPSQGVQWGSGTAYNVNQMKQLLGNNVSYATWRANHLAAALRLEANSR